MVQYKPQEFEEEIFYFYDNYPCFKLRQFIFKIATIVSFYSNWIVKSGIYETISIIVILLNSTFILISNPNDPKNLNDLTDDYFLYFYTFEAILKIFAYGFFWFDDSYLKDSWNILDFTIITVGWFTFILSIIFLKFSETK